MGAFAKFQQAKATGGGFRYPKAGNHVVRVKSVKLDQSRKNIEFFAVEALILESTSSDPDMHEGNTVDWSTHADKDAYAGNVKQFVAAAYNVSENELNNMPAEEFEQAMSLLVGSEQAATGKVLTMICVDRQSKTGNNYVAVRWESMTEEQAAKYAA